MKPLNAICRALAICLVLFMAGCGLFSSGGQEEQQSQPGRTTFRAVGEPTEESDQPAPEKVPGEMR